MVRLLGQDFTILIIDDSPEIRTIVKFYVESLGGVCLEASTGQEALDVISTNPPDIVLCDVHLGNESGLEVAARIKEEHPELRVLGITADPPDPLMNMQSPFDAILEKPIDREKLGLALELHLSRAVVASQIADDESLKEILLKYVHKLPERLETLEKLWQSGDLKALRSKAHQLKGSAGGYGYPALSHLAHRLESVCDEGNAHDAIVSPLLNEIREMIMKIRKGV